MTFNKLYSKLNPEIKERKEQGYNYFTYEEIIDILGELEHNYAPEVVMTTEELEIFNSYRLNNDLPAPFTTLLANINEYNVNDWSDEAFVTQSEEDLMTTWLHPEVIKVKGDK